MPSNNCHVQTGSCMLIAVPLNASCQIIATAPTHVTAGVSKFDGKANRKAGTDYSAVNFGGASCGPESFGDTVEKWLDITGEFCLKDWAFMAATSGNPVVLDADGNTVGYASLTGSQGGACAGVNKPRVALVIVRRAMTDDGNCGSPVGAGMTPCVGHFFPNVGDWLWDLPGFEDVRSVNTLEAKGYANASIGAGPLNLWPAAAVPDEVPPTAFHAEVFLDCSTLPAIDCNSTISHPAPRADAS